MHGGKMNAVHLNVSKSMRMENVKAMKKLRIKTVERLGGRKRNGARPVASLSLSPFTRQAPWKECMNNERT